MHRKFANIYDWLSSYVFVMKSFILEVRTVLIAMTE